MPRTAARIAEALLPGIFQRRRTPNGQIPGGLDPATGAIWEAPHDANPLGNVLAPPDDPMRGEVSPRVMRLPSSGEVVVGPQGRIEGYGDERDVQPLAASRPRLAAQPVIQPQAENMLAPQDTDVYGQPSRSGQVMDENAIRDRRVETNTKGRPVANTVLQGDEQTLDYNQRLATMQPDKEGGGWWPKIRAALAGFAAGGPAGAAAAFGTRALREHFDPELGSREYQRQEMGKLAPAVETIRQNRKDELDTEGKRAQIDLAKARTDAAGRTKGDFQLIERTDGIYRIDRQSGKSEKLAGIPVEAGKPGSTRYIARQDGVYGINAEHPEGFKVKGIPGNKGKDAEDVTFGNQQINRAIGEAQAEQKKIDQGLVGIPRTIEGVDPLTGVKKMVANPDYTYNMTRRRQLDDDIRNWRIKLKSGKAATVAEEEGSDEDSDIRAYADQYFGGDYAAAEKAARQ